MRSDHPQAPVLIAGISAAVAILALAQGLYVQAGETQRVRQEIQSEIDRRAAQRDKQQIITENTLCVILGELPQEGAVLVLRQQLGCTDTPHPLPTPTAQSAPAPAVVPDRAPVPARPVPSSVRVVPAPAVSRPAAGPTVAPTAAPRPTTPAPTARPSPSPSPTGLRICIAGICL